MVGVQNTLSNQSNKSSEVSNRHKIKGLQNDQEGVHFVVGNTTTVSTVPVQGSQSRSAGFVAGRKHDRRQLL